MQLKNTLNYPMADFKIMRRTILIFLFICLASYISTELLVKFHNQVNWKEILEVPTGVLNGDPHWRAYQNRLLTPILWRFLTHMGLDHFTSFVLIIFFGLFANFYVLVMGLNKINRSIYFILIAISCWAILFQALNHYWLYLWDISDILIFSALSYLMLFSTKPYHILLLFPVALINRESALFIPIAFWLKEHFINKQEKKSMKFLAKDFFLSVKALVAILLVTIGAIYTKFIRDLLFKNQQEGIEQWSHMVMGNHFYLPGNIKNFFFFNFYDENVFLSIFVGVFISALLFIFFTRAFEKLKPLIIFVGIFFSSLLVFGNATETRIYYPLITPIVLIFSVTINKHIRTSRKNYKIKD